MLWLVLGSGLVPDSVYTNAFEKQHDYLLENSELHCHITTNYERVVGPVFVYGM